MKKIKTIVSLLLAAVMLLSCTSVFASAAYPDKITTIWGDKYGYAGEITLGETTVKADESYSYYYYVLNVENEGYYTINYNSDGAIGWLYVLEKYYSSYYEELDDVAYGDGQHVVYLHSGENYLGVSFGEAVNKTEKINIEYMGTEITDISFDAGVEYPLILDYDIYNGSSYLRLDDFDLVFDTGKKAEFTDAREYFNCYCEEDIVIGENDFEIEVEGRRFAKKLNVARITDYIEKVELVNGEIYETVYYDESIYGGYDIILKVTYTDGTSITVNPGDEISLKNGNPNLYRVYCWIYQDAAEVEIAGHEFLEIAYEANQASLTENLEVFFSNIEYEFNYISRIPAHAEAIFNQDSAADTLRAIGDFVSFVNNQFLYAIGDIYTNIIMLISAIS